MEALVRLAKEAIDLEKIVNVLVVGSVMIEFLIVNNVKTFVLLVSKMQENVQVINQNI